MALAPRERAAANGAAGDTFATRASPSSAATTAKREVQNA
jgi:hypothetical protein